MNFGVRIRIALLVAFSALVLGSCSGGDSTVGGSTGFDCGNPDAAILCLESCNLGCSTTGCAQSDIAQNQIVILRFSEAVDTNSVNNSSIRFRTPTGDEPVGEYFVNGSIVEFVPTLSISGGQTFFGFTNGETYTMTIVGGENEAEVVRSTSGRPFAVPLVCTLQSTRGIVDLNGVPPSAALVVPTAQQVGAAPLETEIVIEFNELIDATPFLSGTQSPVAFTVRRTRDDGNGGFECDPSSQPQTLSGSQSLSFDAGRGVSVLTFLPSQPLPGNVCIEVSVTDGVTDLSGRPAQPQVFLFQTIIVELNDVEIVETFANTVQFDSESSAGEWGNGQASFAQIGGDGRHGAFDLSLAVDTGQTFEGKSVYELSTDNTIVPPANTTTGSAIAVTDGRFFFSRMVLPSNARLRFVGSVPPVITVAGTFDIQGDIEVVGGSILTPQSPVSSTGQMGGPGGVFAGAGGQGGDRCLGFGPGTGEFDGRDGGTVSVLANHSYLGSVAATAGRGSVLFPASGLGADRLYPTSPPNTPVAYCLMAAAGGSGGGFYTPGGEGRVTGIFNGTAPVPSPGQFIGPSAPGGSAFQLFPFPVAGSLPSSQHFLVGGSGGGGAGSNPTLSLSVGVAGFFASGAGGGGGGGAMALRAGRTLRLGAQARLLAHGGSATDFNGASASAQVAPAGGGSGGSIVLQSAGEAELNGLIDVRGGAGGDFDRQSPGGGVAPVGGRVVIEGGDGGDGFVRFELPTAPLIGDLASMEPAATADNVGPLVEVDELIAIKSNFYSTELVFGPAFSHYVIEATVDGMPMVFSDNPAISTMEASVGAPLRALFQAANLDVTTSEVLEVRPWRTSVRSSSSQTGIASDGFNGYRFLLLQDRSLAANVTVEQLTVVYRN
ncbi:MAG: Ig-like domain-containing protein [Planctomycetota bacterium]